MQGSSSFVLKVDGAVVEKGSVRTDARLAHGDIVCVEFYADCISSVAESYERSCSGAGEWVEYGARRHPPPA